MWSVSNVLVVIALLLTLVHLVRRYTDTVLLSVALLLLGIALLVPNVVR